MDELLSEIAGFIAQHNMSERDFGRLAIGDHNLLRDLRGEGPIGKPRSPSLRTVDKIRVFMREYQPQPAAA